MSKFFIIVVLCVVSVSRVYADYPSERLMQVILSKESGGNDRAIGDQKDSKGHPRPSSQWAYGPLQIRQKALDDVNRKFGTHHKSSDCLGNRKLSEWVFREYINMYATKKRLGHKPTDADMAGIWNGGPNGWRSGLTVDYRQDIEDRLKNA